MYLPGWKSKEKRYKLGTSVSKYKSDNIGDQRGQFIIQGFLNEHVFPDIWWSYRNVSVGSFKNHNKAY